MSQLEVDKIIPQSGTTLTIGDSGDTITFADGAVIGIDTNTLYIDSTNNRVGIGTSSPSSPLHVEGGSDVAFFDGNNVRLKIQNPSTGVLQLNSSGSGDSLSFATVDSERMRITSSGFVGIGTSSPSSGLEVNNADGIIVSRTGYSQYMQLQPSNNNVPTILGLGGNGVHIGPTNSTGMRIDSSGNVGIGTSSPKRSFQIGDNTDSLEILSIQSTTSGSSRIYFGSNDGTNAEYSGYLWYDHSNDSLRIATDSTERMRIDSSGNVGIGTSSPDSILHLYSNNSGGTPQSRSALIIEDTEANGDSIQFLSVDTGFQSIFFGDASDNDVGRIAYSHSGDSMRFNTNGSERMRIDSYGAIGIGTGSPLAFVDIEDSNNPTLRLNDTGTAGSHTFIQFRVGGSLQGDIDTTDGSVIRYNTFTGAHWSQFHDGTNPELKKGTVMSLTSDKLEYSKCEKTITKEDGTEELQKYEIAGTHEIGSEVTVPNDEYGEENSTTTATVVSNSIADHLVKVKVSDSIADKGVYGVWAGKYNDGDLSVEALGTSTIRIKQGEVLEVGDLLESAGDGTAQKQSDDIIKNSTIAKVTSPTPIETFDDNSFLVSCVLYCG